QALLKQGVISEKDLKNARIERYIIGPIFNFDFFYSPIEDDGEKLELLGIDWRFETSLDGHVRLPAQQQRTLNNAQRIPEYVVVGHNAATLRESSLNDVFAIAERYVKATQQHFPPGIIGPFTLQTAVDKDLQFWVYDVSPRIGGGTNVHMSLGHPYGNSLWRRPMSTGRRIAMEIRRGIDTGRLGELVTLILSAAFDLSAEAVQDVVVFFGHHAVHHAAHEPEQALSRHLRVVADLRAALFRGKGERHLSAHRLSIDLEAQLRRRPVQGHLNRGFQGPVPCLARLFPGGSDSDGAGRHIVDALDGGHPLFRLSEVREDRKDAFGRRADDRGSRKGHAPSRGLGPLKPTGGGMFVNPRGDRRTLMRRTSHRPRRRKGLHRMLQNLLFSAGSIAVGFVLLNQGAKFITDNATRISGRIGRSRFVFGALFVSTLSALPELLVSGIAAEEGSPDIALGNALASTVVTIAFVIGVSALVRPIKTSREIVLRDAVFLAIVSLVAATLLLDGNLTQYEGVALIALFVPYILNLAIS